MASPRAAPPRLPGGVEPVLDTFRDAHDATVTVRLDGGETEARRLYPADPALAVHAGEVRRHVVGPGDRPLVLEVSGADADATAVLASAVAELARVEREAQAAARELAERYEEINLLYTISEILGSILSLERAAERMLAEVADVLGARRASLWVHHPEDARLYLTAAVGEKGMTGPIPIDEPSSVTAWVFRERRALNLERDSELPPGIRMDL
ncbi:MAG: hypothetical protein ACODAE_10880, partial [Gemmatimonadota bacterium]